MPNPSKEPPASSIAPNQDLKNIDFLCTFKIKIEGQILDHGCIRDLSRSRQESTASSKAPNEDLKDIDVLGTFKIK